MNLGPRFVQLALAAWLWLCPNAARAEEPQKRPVPDYDGRGGAPKTPGQRALWIPRVLLFPAYVVSEYLIRRPLGFAITAAEKWGVPGTIYNFLDLGTTHPIGVVPFGLLDFGFEPSVGLYAYWDNAGFEGHQLRLRGSTWGKDWLSATATERFHFDQLDLALTSTFTRRQDYAFYGLGPDTREASLTRYSGDTAYARFESHLTFNRRDVLETSLGYRGAKFGHTDYDADNRGNFDYEVSLDEAIASGEIEEPPGFRDGYNAPFGQVRVVLDSRGTSESTNGFRLDLNAEQSADLANSPTSGWLRYGGTLWGFLDVRDGGRAVSVGITVQMVDPLGDRPVPFTQLVTLGGGRTMPGFRSGRLYDRSALVSTLRYAWPIWLGLNGSLQSAFGNVFGEHLAGFRPGRMRLSAAVGLETNGSRDNVFQALVGFGTETFESGAEFDSIRVVLGVRNGF